MTNWLIDFNGYVYKNVKVNDKWTKKYQHDEVIEEILGRPLKKDECVHHIDGNPQNNDKKNLVCCTLKGHSEIHHPKRFFSKHPVLKRRIRLRKFHVPKEILEKLVWEMPTEKVAKIFGVSGKAIEKRCKLLGIVKPPRGYWRKVETSTLC